MKKKIVFCGIRNRLETIILAQDLGYEILGYIDDDYFVGYEKYGLKIIGTYKDLMSDKSNIVTDIKDSVEFFPTKYFISSPDYLINETRLSIIDMLDASNVKVANLVNPTVKNLDRLNVQLGKGVSLDRLNRTDCNNVVVASCSYFSCCGICR